MIGVPPPEAGWTRLGPDPLRAGGRHWPYRIVWWTHEDGGLALVLTEYRRQAPTSFCPGPRRYLRRTGLPAARLDAVRALAAEHGARLWVALVHSQEGEIRGRLSGGFPEDQRNDLNGELTAFVDYDTLGVWPCG
jgi:hypothetical protein